MPIVISRNTDDSPVVTGPLTPQQKEELWAHIVRSWVDKNTDRFAAMVKHGVQEVPDRVSA